MRRPVTEKSRFLSRPVLLQLSYALLFNTAIAVLLWLVLHTPRFLDTWLVSQSIGLSIFFSFYLFSLFMELKGWLVSIPLSVGAVGGVLLGLLVSLLRGNGQLGAVLEVMRANSDQLLVNLFLAFFFGIIILYFFISRERHYQATQALKESQIKNLDHKKQIAETQLQLLQAQIEPHFLFNSLSNVISLIEHDPLRAKRMLESLTRYLRASLSRSHDKNGSLQDELDLIENYLKILQIRMGQRLQYVIRIDEPLLACRFPIMLLQPLVENAIQHGLEPLPEGGCLEVDVQRNKQALQIKVIDNGVGLKQTDLKGYGLMNVRQRLQSLYGDAAKFKIEDNIPRGVMVSMEMPCA